MTAPYIALTLTTLGVGLAFLTRKAWRWLFGRDDALGAALHGEPDGFPFWEPEIGLIAESPEDEALLDAIDAALRVTTDPDEVDGLLEARTAATKERAT